MAQKRMIETALDSLPCGSEEQATSSKVGKVALPDGVSGKQLTRDVVLLSWPSLLELVLSQLTSFVDQIMVGRIPGQMGVAALAAVGLANQPKMVLMMAIQALNVGATAVIARYRGQQNREKANQVFRHALILNVVLSAVLMIVGLLGAEWMVRFMGPEISEATIAAGVSYLRIQLFGLIPLCLTFTMTAALRGVGNSRIPMIYNTIANVVNVVLNYILIYGKFGAPALGVEGASLATVIGQTVAFIIAIFVVLRKTSYLNLGLKERFVFDKVILSNVARVGVPAMIEQVLMRVGIIIFARTVSSLGDLKYATHQILMSIQAFSFMLGQAFATASTTMVGQSLGKRRYDMAIIYMNRTKNIARIASVILMVIVILLRKGIVGLFTTDQAVISLGAEIMFLIAISQPIQSDQFVISGALRGAGDTRFTAFSMLVTILVVRGVLAILLVNVFGLELWGAWIALLADLLIRTILVAWRFRSGKWKSIKFKEVPKH